MIFHLKSTLWAIPVPVPQQHLVVRAFIIPAALVAEVVEMLRELVLLVERNWCTMLPFTLAVGQQLHREHLLRQRLHLEINTPVYSIPQVEHLLRIGSIPLVAVVTVFTTSAAQVVAVVEVDKVHVPPAVPPWYTTMPSTKTGS